VQTARAAPQPEPAPSRKEAPKQAAARPAVAQAEPAQTGGGFARWLPMALAPADKPVAKQPQRLTGPAYSSKVWSALARHKPRAGQRGSATVVFSIGMGGSLNSVSIGKSSGNARIDQLALATVRGAAPFPPPPSGPASFTIRIDFH
jgi:protein TonB